MGGINVKNMILLDIETLDFSVDSGIYEVALLVIKDGEIVASEQIAEVEDESLIHLGMGEGYAEISEDISKINQFKDIIDTYQYPVVAHNVSFDRKFLVHYGWLEDDYECFDSLRAIKYANPHLFSYSLEYLVAFYGINVPVKHTAIDDVIALYEVIMRAAPSVWIPLYQGTPKEMKNLVESAGYVEGQSTLFQDKRIVFTGTSQFPRLLMKEIAIKCSAKVSGSITSKTDLLICGENPGSKLDKAKELGIEIQTDAWFIDAVSSDLNLETAAVTYRRVAATSEVRMEFNKIPELKGKNVNIALLPFKVQSKLELILTEHIEVSSINKGTNGFKVDVIIHSDHGEYALLKKAEELNIRTLPLSKFNQLLLKDTTVD